MTSAPPMQAATRGRPDAARPATWAAALGGALAVAVMLALLELVAGLVRSVPSLVASVGEFFIPFTPSWLKDWAIDLFGTTDKAVLMGVVVTVALLAGAAVGRSAVAAPSMAPGIFAAVGLFGLLTALRTPGTALLPTVLALLAAVAVGVGLLQLALRYAPRAHAGTRDGEPRPSDVEDGGPAPLAEEERRAADERAATDEPAPLGRRPFLAAGAAVGVGAVAAGAGGRALLRQRAAEVADQLAALPRIESDDTLAQVGPANRLQVDGITPIVVPNEDFYRIDTALQVPLVDPTTWTLRVHGMVDTELELTYDDLVERDLVERHVTLSCVSNEVGGGLVGNAAWTGALLAPLLEEAGVQPGATQLVGRSVDGWTAGFPTEVALDGRDAMLAVQMNGAPLPADHGYPARLVVPGLYGYVSATKWISEIELTTWEGFDGYWVPRGWSKLGPIKTQSRIDVPADGTRVEPGPTTIAGVAWAPGRGVARVEVRRERDEWQEARVTTPLSDDAWVQWAVELELPEGPSQVQVRATDGRGQTQTDTLLPPRPDGATGWHTVRVFT